MNWWRKFVVRRLCKAFARKTIKLLRLFDRSDAPKLKAGSVFSTTEFMMTVNSASDHTYISIVPNPFLNDSYAEFSPILHEEFSKNGLMIQSMQRTSYSIAIKFPRWYRSIFSRLSYIKNPLLEGGVYFSTDDFSSTESFNAQFDVIKNPDNTSRLTPKKEWKAGTGELMLVSDDEPEHEEVSSDDNEGEEVEYPSVTISTENGDYIMSEQRISSIKKRKKRSSHDPEDLPSFRKKKKKFVEVDQ